MKNLLRALRYFRPDAPRIAVVGLLDFALGWNYGYLIRRPLRPSLLDHLGPWPWYIISATVVAGRVGEERRRSWAGLSSHRGGGQMRRQVWVVAVWVT